MGPHGVVVTPPVFDYNLGLVERAEDFAIEVGYRNHPVARKPPGDSFFWLTTPALIQGDG